MKPILILPLAAITLSTLALSGCGQAKVEEASTTIGGAWCRPTPNGATSAACYATLKTGQDDRLVSIATPAASGVAIHDMSTEGGMMKMAEMTDGLVLKAKQSVALAPGGKHMMLTGLTAPLVAGQTVPLTLTFDKAGAVQIEAAVRPTAP